MSSLVFLMNCIKNSSCITFSSFSWWTSVLPLACLCDDVQYSSSAGTCEAMPLSATVVQSGWWRGWRTPTPQYQMLCVLDRRTWRTSASMIWAACMMSASQRVRNIWASWPCLKSSWPQPFLPLIHTVSDAKKRQKCHILFYQFNVARIVFMNLLRFERVSFRMHFPQISSSISLWRPSLSLLTHSVIRTMSTWLLLLPAQRVVWFSNGTT